MAAIFADDISLNENVWISIKKFTTVCFSRPNWQYSSIGLDNDLAPNRRQAIIWTNGGLVYWGIYAWLGLNVFKKGFADKTNRDVMDIWVLFNGANSRFLLAGDFHKKMS